MTLVTQLSLTTVELLQNGLQPHPQATPLWSMRTVSQVSSQRWCFIDAWCKGALTPVRQSQVWINIVCGPVISVLVAGQWTFGLRVNTLKIAMGITKDPSHWEIAKAKLFSWCYRLFTLTYCVSDPMFPTEFVISERKWVQYPLIYERISELVLESDDCATVCILLTEHS